MRRRILTPAAALAVALSCVVNGNCADAPSPMAAVAESPAGRTLLADLQSACGPPPEVGLELFIAQLEARVSDLTGRLVDGSAPEFVDAARTLERVPRRLRRDSLVTVIVLLDEWSARTSTLPLGQRALTVLKEHSWSKQDDLRCRQIDERFPFLAPRARGILNSVGVRTPSSNHRSTAGLSTAPSTGEGSPKIFSLLQSHPDERSPEVNV